MNAATCPDCDRPYDAPADELCGIAEAHECPDYLPPERLLLDWTDRRHYAGRELTCRWCAGVTLLLDAVGRPSNKVCCEERVAALLAEAVVA